MKNKVINLFNKPQGVQTKGVKYSVLLEQFIEPFTNDFADVEYYEDIFEFAINAWNLGNMKLILPEGESDAAMSTLNGQDIDVGLLKRMIDYKVSHFKEYTNFIADYDIAETNGEPVLSVITEEQDSFLNSMFENMETENMQDDFEENYINRSAIIIKPLQPFLDWYLNLYPNGPEELEEVKEAKTYLISEDIEDEEAWLKKKFDKIFRFELESWHLNKKEWPQKRNYKMFKEWFRVDISTMIYDFETKPVSKSE